MPLIRIDDVSVELGGRRILHNVSMEVARGEIVTVVGPNGSGKTTLLKAMIGALPVASGRVWRAPGLEIGYVPQRLTLSRRMPMTLERFLNLSRKSDRERVQAALARTGALGLEDRQIEDLSGGQLQRALLARAILHDPAILLLDEPTQGLDQPASASFYRLIEDLRRDLGLAVLMVSHELHVVMSASDRVVCLNGHVCCEGTPEVIRDAPEYRALFGPGTGGALALYRHEHDHAHDATGGRVD